MHLIGQLSEWLAKLYKKILSDPYDQINAEAFSEPPVSVVCGMQNPYAAPLLPCPSLA